MSVFSNVEKCFSDTGRENKKQIPCVISNIQLMTQLYFEAKCIVNTLLVPHISVLSFESKRIKTIHLKNERDNSVFSLLKLKSVPVLKQN